MKCLRNGLVLLIILSAATDAAPVLRADDQFLGARKLWNEWRTLATLTDMRRASGATLWLVQQCEIHGWR
jgi:hypothetical protein